MAIRFIRPGYDDGMYKPGSGGATEDRDRLLALTVNIDVLRQLKADPAATLDCPQCDQPIIVAVRGKLVVCGYCGHDFEPAADFGD